MTLIMNHSDFLFFIYHPKRRGFTVVLFSSEKIFIIITLRTSSSFNFFFSTDGYQVYFCFRAEIWFGFANVHIDNIVLLTFSCKTGILKIII